MEGYCSLHIEKMKKVIHLAASEPESNANLIIFGLLVDYKGTPGMDRVVTCHLSFLEKSLKDNGKSGMFIKALKR